MNNKKRTGRVSYFCFRILRGLVKLFYPKMQLSGTQHLTQEPTVFVGNHAQMNGPICGELYAPKKCLTWCAWQMMYLKEVPGYAFQDFWSQKSRSVRWFYKGLSYLIAPLCVCIFNNAATIGVFHDSRLVTTFKKTLTALEGGTSVIIFPECYTPYNHIVNTFQDHFLDIAKLYYKRTGKALTFTPLYIAPELKRMVLGKPIAFQPEIPMDLQRQHLCRYLMDTVTEIAEQLPPHTVVPYANIPRKDYPKNREGEATYEKTGCQL